MADVFANGLTHHVQRIGVSEGRVVVFIHGLVMDNLSSWYFSVANRVAEARPCLLYDLRGHGYTERPSRGYDLMSFCTDLASLLDAQNVSDPVDIVGNSFGGLLGLVFAQRHPQRVASLVLVDALLPEPGWSDAMTATLSLQGQERDQQIVKQFSSWLGRNSQRKRNRLARQASGLVEDTTLLEDIRNSPTFPDSAWSDISCPVLALYGAQSDQRDRGERLHNVLPACTLEVLDGCTHSILWEATEHLRDRVLLWMNEVASK